MALNDRAFGAVFKADGHPGPADAGAKFRLYPEEAASR
jgi:hypothetical protein